MDKFEKERTNKEENIYKKTLGMTGMIGWLTIFLSLYKILYLGLKTSLFKTKDYSKPEPVKIVYGGGKKLRKPKKTKQ